MVSTRANPPGVRLHGRRGECDAIDRLLDRGTGRDALCNERGVGTVGLPQLALEGLDDADARELLRSSVVPGRLDERVAARLVAETHGNPLRCSSYRGGLTASELAGSFGLPGALSVQGKIEESHGQALRAASR